ncbi:unnamed protein product [Sphagnum balticum]
MDPSSRMSFSSSSSHPWILLWWCLGLFLLLSVLLSTPMVLADHPAWLAETRESNSPLVAPPSPQGLDEPMMVVSKDGGLHALDPVSKKKRWSFSSGEALCSTYSSHFADVQEQGNDHLTTREYSSIFLGPNGALYVEDVSGVNKLPVTVEQLVERSPYQTDQGTVVLSSVTNTAFLLNRDSGALIRKFDNSGSALLKKAASSHSTGGSGSVNANDAELLLGSDPGKNTSVDDNVPTILCIRTDYSVSVHEVATGIVHWNISFGDIKILSKMPPGYQSQQTIAGQPPNVGAGGSGKELIPTFGHPHSSGMVQQKLQMAPFAIFSSSGEFVNHLLPELQEESSSSSSHGKQLPALPTPRDYQMSTKITDPHHNITSPTLAPADHRGLVPVLMKIGESKQVSQTVENSPFYTEGDRPNSRHATHGDSSDFSYRSMISLLLLIVLAVCIFCGVILAILNFAMLVYKEFRTKKEHDNNNFNKEKKVGGGAGGNKKKKARKGSNLMKGSSGEDLHEGGGGPKQYGTENGSEALVDGAKTPGKKWQWMDTAAYGDGIQVGRLFVTKVTIGVGSNGTTVFEGYLDGRKVAVKRLLGHYYEKAQKEIALLITSDEHPNVVRYYAMEETPDFIYVALERCSLSLNDLILSQSAQSPFQNDKRDSINLTDEKQLKLASGKELKLWDKEGYPSLQLLQLMRDIASGLAHLHSLGIVHRDLKPQNVLVSNGRILQAKLADMGLSKHLANDASSFQATGGSGSRGWQAPEQLTDGRQTRAVDVFTLGCVLFFCITGGQHPFGEHYHRDYNIANDKADLFCIEDMPEVHHLIQALLNHDASKRPVAQDVVLHPLFWNSDERLSFLRDASDRVELEDREDNSAVLAAVEAIGPIALGGTWDVHLDPDLLENLRRYRRYNFNSVRDLLRVIRNKSNHYRELPQNVQDLLGPVPEGYESYFRARFPRLLIEIYKVLIDHCKDERMFKRYFAWSQP